VRVGTFDSDSPVDSDLVVVFVGVSLLEFDTERSVVPLGVLREVFESVGALVTDVLKLSVLFVTVLALRECACPDSDWVSLRVSCPGATLTVADFDACSERLTELVP